MLLEGEDGGRITIRPYALTASGREVKRDGVQRPSLHDMLDWPARHSQRAALIEHGLPRLCE